MGKVRKLLSAYGLGSKQSKAHKQHCNPADCCIQVVKVTTPIDLDHSGAPSWSWLLYMSYVAAILNCMSHRSLSWLTPYETAYRFTPDVSQLIELLLWESVLILDNKTQFTESRKIFGYYAGPAPNKGDIDFSWVWTVEDGLLAQSFLWRANSTTDPNHRVCYQSVGRWRQKPLLNPSTSNPYINFG